jgi:hypothetical protein
MVTHVFHVLLTTRISRAARVRWTEVSRDLSNDVVEGTLYVENLILASIRINLRQIKMGPCVGRNLVSLRIHALDNVDEFLSLVNLSLCDVVASDEEGSLCIVLLEEIQDSRSGVLHRPVIVSDCDMTGIFAGNELAEDAGASIFD